jgi:1,4-alpha-glucan branching enzyme
MTFPMMYAFSERYILPLSHDEVVHGKKSLLHKMPGDAWRRFANLRCLLGWQFAQPGKKLLFMGAEIGQRREWNHDRPLDWELLDEPAHAGLQALVRELNRLYRTVRPLHQRDTEPAGFEWVDPGDEARSVLSFLRKGRDLEECVLVVGNFTPLPRPGVAVGVPRGGKWNVVLNTDDPAWSGSGLPIARVSQATEDPSHGRPWRLTLTLPPLSILYLQPDSSPSRKR